MEIKHKSFKEMCQSFTEKLKEHTPLIDFSVGLPTLIDSNTTNGQYKIVDVVEHRFPGDMPLATLDNGNIMSGSFSKSDVGKMVMISDKGTFEIKSISTDHLEEEMKYYEHLATQAYKMNGISTKIDPKYRPVRFKEAQARRRRRAPW